MNNVLYAKPNYNTHREIRKYDGATGAPLAVDDDSADLAVVKAANPKGPLDCGGFDTVFVAVDITAGGAADVTLQPLEAVTKPDGSWEFRVLAANIGPINEASQLQEVTVNGGNVFLRLHDTNGNPTVVEILVAGGAQMSQEPGFRRKR